MTMAQKQKSKPRERKRCETWTIYSEGQNSLSISEQNSIIGNFVYKKGEIWAFIKPLINHLHNNPLKIYLHYIFSHFVIDLILRVRPPEESFSILRCYCVIHIWRCDIRHRSKPLPYENVNIWTEEHWSYQAPFVNPADPSNRFDVALFHLMNPFEAFLRPSIIFTVSSASPSICSFS